MQATQAKSKFLANMSHELRTPLNAIIGYSEMLSEEAEDLGQEDFIPDLERIHSAGKHLLSLINDILDLSKIEAGKMDVLVEEFDVGTLLNQVLSLIDPIIIRNANRLQPDFSNDLGAMRSDETKIRQSLINLLSNASKFAKDGAINFIVRRFRKADDDWLEFKIADNGIGMTPEQLKRLFQAFSQADQTTSRDYGGTGLGLAITKHFCQLLGGDIEVESDYGEGSVFTISLPAILRQLGSVHPVQSVELNHEANQKHHAGTVLVIDDDAEIHDFLSRELPKQGYKLHHASAGLTGLKMAKELNPDLIILDIIMPDLDGWSVLKSLKSDSALNEIPVLILTVMEDRELGFALGAADFVNKPIDRDQLTRAIKRHCIENEAQVLIVDDDPQARDVLKRILIKEGWKVAEASNGKEAIHRLADIKPALVLLDLLMPEMNGFELLETLRSNPLWSQIPVVIITAKDPSSQEMELLRGNVVQVLQKGSYDRKRLINDIQHLIAEQELKEVN